MIDSQVDALLNNVSNIKGLLSLIGKRPDIMYEYDKLMFKLHILAKEGNEYPSEVLFDLFDSPCKGSYDCLHVYVNTYLETKAASYTHFDFDDVYYTKFMTLIDKQVYQDIHSSLPKSMEAEFNLKYGLIIKAILDVYYPYIDPKDNGDSEFISALFTDNLSFFSLLAMIDNKEWVSSFVSENIPSSLQNIVTSIFTCLADIYSHPDSHANFYIEVLALNQKEQRDVYDIIERYTQYIGDYAFDYGTEFVMILRTEKSDVLLKYLINYVSEVALKSQNINPTILASFFKDLASVVEFKCMNSLRPDIYKNIDKCIVDGENKYVLSDNVRTTAYYVSESLNSINLNFKSFDYFENALEAYKQNSKTIHDAQNKIYKAYKAYKDEESKVDSQLSKAIIAMKKVATGDIRTQLIEGKEFSAIGLLKKVLGTVALFNVSKVALIIGIVVRYAAKKQTTDSERKKILLELKGELEMIEEKIEDAKGDGNRKAKYELMRVRTELKNAIDRIQYGLDADKGSMKTAKNILSQQKATV